MVRVLADGVEDELGFAIFWRYRAFLRTFSYGVITAVDQSLAQFSHVGFLLLQVLRPLLILERLTFNFIQQQLGLLYL